MTASRSRHRPSPRPRRGWIERADLPKLTVGVLSLLALIPWLSAIVNRYRFNVVLAVLASVPLAVVLVRGALTARAAKARSTVTRDRPAGDVDYEADGPGYPLLRRTDPRIAALVVDALGDARTVINVGAGAGSYEPTDREVVAVEPSASMRAQRPADRVAAIDATAESLPFADDSFDAAMAMVTIHQWSDPDLGLRQLRRVARGPVVVLTFDGEALDRFWLADYVPELIDVERRRFPSIAAIGKALGGQCDVLEVPIPIDCVDGFTEAYYARPERFLDPAVRQSQSAWGFVDDAVTIRAIEALQADLDSGEWDRRHGPLRSEPVFVGALRLIVARPSIHSE